MKCLILNSGFGSRLKHLINNSHKSLLQLNNKDTILSRQINILSQCGIKSFFITTGYSSDKIINYCNTNLNDKKIEFVYNDKYESTNYIYSIYKAKEKIKNDDIILLHGDLVFDKNVIQMVLNSKKNVVVVSSTANIPLKDFKAQVINNKVINIGVEFFNNVMASQPLYKFDKKSFNIWLDKIVEYCENGVVNCYAEKAFNDVSHKCDLEALDIKNMLCAEIDNEDDYNRIKGLINE